MGLQYKSTDMLEKPDMSVELKKMQTDISSALDQLMKSVDAKNDATVRNLTDHITKYNDHADKHARDKKMFEDMLKAAEAKAEAADKRVKDLETQIATKGIGHNGGPPMDDRGFPNPYCAERQEPEYKSFFGMMSARPNTSQLADNVSVLNRQAIEQKDAGMFRTDDLARGGYLVPPVTDSVIRKKVVELSPVRAYARVRPLMTKTMSIVTEKAVLDSFFEGEAEAAPESENLYGEETVTAWRQGVKVKLTYDQLIMSPFNMEAEISSSVGRSFAKKEGYMFLKGTGNKTPAGILGDQRVQKVVSKTTGKITYDDIAELIGSMKAGYNPMLFFGRGTFAQLIQLKDGYERPLWAPVAGDKPATIWDHPYTSTFIDMDQMQAGSGTNGVSNSMPIMYADLAMGYEIFDLQGMSVIRDDVTQADKSIIIYNFRRWLTAKVTMPEAIKILKVK